MKALTGRGERGGGGEREGCSTCSFLFLTHYTQAVQHQLFYQTRSAVFVDRPDITEAIQKYLSVPSPKQPLVLLGESGSGKYPFFFVFVVTHTNLGNTHPDILLIIYFD